jgi:acyl-CoA thioesterase
MKPPQNGTQDEFSEASLRTLTTAKPMSREEHKAIQQQRIKARRDNEDRAMEREIK